MRNAHESHTHIHTHINHVLAKLKTLQYFSQMQKLS